MIAEQEDVFYYLTLMNENYPHPAMPEGARGGDPARDVPAARRRGRRARSSCWARARSCARCSPAPSCCARTSASTPTSGASRRFTELRRDGHGGRALEPLHPGEEPRGAVGRAVARRAPGPGRRRDRLHARVRRTRSARGSTRPYRVLGTDGFGRSDYRKALRRFFEVDRHHVALAALTELARPARSTRTRRRRRSSPTASTPSGPRRGGCEGGAVAGTEQVLVPDIGDFDDVPVIEVLVAVGRHRRRRGPAVVARVRQGDDGGPVAGRRQVAEIEVAGRRHGQGGLADPARSRSAAATAPRRRRGRRRRGGRAPTARGRGRVEAASRPRRRPRRRARARRRSARRRRRPARARRRPTRARRAPAGARARRRPLGVARHRPQGPDHQGGRAAGRRTQPRPRRRGAGGPAVAGLDLAPWPKVNFERYGEVEREPLTPDPEDQRPEPRPQLGDDPARHAQRRGGHHRARGVPQAAQRRAVRGQGDDGRAAG